MNYDPKMLKNFLFNSPSYKHVNSFLPALVDDFCIDVPMQQWFNNVDNLCFLRCMEKLEWNDQMDDKEFEDIIQKKKKGETLSVMQWCNAIKGKTLLVANGQYFVSEYVAVKLALHFGGQEMIEILQPSFDTMYENDKSYEQYFIAYREFQSLSKGNQQLAIHYLAETDRLYYSYFHTGKFLADILTTRAKYLSDVLFDMETSIRSYNP